jgi:hypothetical protein
MPTKPINLKDGSFMTGALYAASPPAFFHALDLLAALSQSRKNQFRMLVRIGLWSLVRYAAGRVSLREAERRLSKAFGAQAIIVTGCDPLMAADIDDQSDYKAILAYANREQA